jgi:uncharacterized membrane protein
MDTTSAPTPKEVLDRVLEFVGFVFVAGPPVAFLLVPWLLLVLLLIPPAALLLTLAAVVFVAGALLAAVGAIVASPYLIVRHIRARHEAAEAPVELPAPRLVPVPTRRSAAA